MNDVIEKLHDGDIFRWSYRDPNTDNRAYGSYHCCSRIAVVKNGRLRDTFWGDNSDSRSFGVEDLPKLELTRVGNFAELEQAKEYQADYYDDADIVNLNHSNSTRDNFYLRKDAKKSQAKMLEVARRNLERSQSNERAAANLSSDLTEAIRRIEAGDLDVHIMRPR